MKLKFPVFIIIMIFWLFSTVQAQAPDPTGVVTALDWSPAGDLVAVAVGVPQTEPCYHSSDYYFIHLLHPDGTLYKDLRRHVCAITSLAFSPDGSRLLSVDRAGFIMMWDVTSGEQLLETDGMFPWQKVAWSADANSVLLVETATAFLSSAPYQEGYLSLVAGRKTSFAGDFTDGSWSPDETRVAVSNDDGSVGIWNVNTTRRSQVLNRFQGHTGAVQAVDWSPEGELVASGDANGVIKVWNATTGQEIASMSDPGGYAVNDLAWSPDGCALASAGDDGQVHIWNFQPSGDQLLPVLTELTSLNYEAPVYALAWSPDGTKIAYGGQGISDENGLAQISELNIVLVPATPVANAGSNDAITDHSWSEGACQGS